VKQLANTDSEKAPAGNEAFSKQTQSATDLRSVETPLKAAFRFAPKPWTTTVMLQNMRTKGLHRLLNKSMKWAVFRANDDAIDALLHRGPPRRRISAPAGPKNGRDPSCGD